MFVFFDDKIIAADQVKLDLTNRSFRYGDGLFETIRMFNYKLPYLDKHLNRLEAGCAVLDMVLEDDFRKNIQGLLIKLAEKNQTPNARLRLMVFRKGGGLYTPETNKASVFIECKKLETASFLWNEKGLKLGIYREMKIQPSIISPYKTNNCLPYILAAIYKKKNNLDECVLLNENNNIADSISSNVFIVKGDQIITPKISDGGVAGTMRSILIEVLKSQNQLVQEKSITENDLLDADEIFLTNAIRGIQAVGLFQGKEYACAKIFNRFNTYEVGISKNKKRLPIFMICKHQKRKSPKQQY